MPGFAVLEGGSLEKVEDGRELSLGILLSAGRPVSFPLAEPLRYSGFSSRVII